MPIFEQQLKVGLIGESEIAQWFISKGYHVLPAYQIELPHGKGPRLFTSTGQLISPDMLVFNSTKIFWIEAKTKSSFTFHRLTRSWQTGIDRKYWQHYLQVQNLVPWDIWILFLHRQGPPAKDTPEGFISPHGLFGNTITFLKDHIDHEHENHGPTGMVYWQHKHLKIIPSFILQTQAPPPTDSADA
jgi:hypothetical protein